MVRQKSKYISASYIKVGSNILNSSNITNTTPILPGGGTLVGSSTGGPISASVYQYNDVPVVDTPPNDDSSLCTSSLVYNYGIKLLTNPSFNGSVNLPIGTKLGISTLTDASVTEISDGISVNDTRLATSGQVYSYVNDFSPSYTNATFNGVTTIGDNSSLAFGTDTTITGTINLPTGTTVGSVGFGTAAFRNTVNLINLSDSDEANKLPNVAAVGSFVTGYAVPRTNPFFSGAVTFTQGASLNFSTNNLINGIVNLPLTTNFNGLSMTSAATSSVVTSISENNIGLPTAGAVFSHLQNSIVTNITMGDTKLPTAGAVYTYVQDSIYTGTGITKEQADAKFLSGELNAQRRYVVQSWWGPVSDSSTETTLAGMFGLFGNLIISNMKKHNTYPGASTGTGYGLSSVPVIFTVNDNLITKNYQTDNTSTCITRYQGFCICPANGNQTTINLYTEGHTAYSLCIYKSSNSYSETEIEAEILSGNAGDALDNEFVLHSTSIALLRGEQFKIVLVLGHRPNTTHKVKFEIKFEDSPAPKIISSDLLLYTQPLFTVSHIAASGLYKITVDATCFIESNNPSIIVTCAGNTTPFFGISTNITNIQDFEVRTYDISGTLQDCEFSFIVVSRGKVYLNGRVSSDGSILVEDKYG